jgi:hypothetical protein
MNCLVCRRSKNTTIIVYACKHKSVLCSDCSKDVDASTNDCVECQHQLLQSIETEIDTQFEKEKTIEIKTSTAITTLPQLPPKPATDMNTDRMWNGLSRRRNPHMFQDIACETCGCYLCVCDANDDWRRNGRSGIQS